jgi:hypothetical protein
VDPVATSPASFWWLSIGLALALAASLFLLLVARKGRRIPGERVFRASRWSRGNRLLPTQVSVTPESVTLFKPQWIGKREESIHISQISSIRIDTNVLFSTVLIESTGGHDPMLCEGHTKGDAVQIKRAIEQYQSSHYKIRLQ